MASTADPLSPDLGMASSRHRRLVIDNEANTTVIRVDSVDTIDLTRVIFDLNLVIVIRKSYFSSDGNHIVNVFHVTDKDGKVLDETAISCIQKLEFDRVEIEMAKEKSHERVTVTNVVDQFPQGPKDKIVFEDVTFSVSSSLKGGINIQLGSRTVHIPQQCSIRHPVLQMVLFAAKVEVPTGILCFRHRDTIPFARRGVAKSILDIIEKFSTDASTADVQRPVLEAGWVVSRKRPAKCNGDSVCTRPGKKPDCRTDRSEDYAGTVPSFMQLHHQPEGSLHLDSVREQEHKEQQCRLKNQDAYALVTTQTPGGGNWVPALWLDSGATHHAVGDARGLRNLRDPPAGTAIRVADGFRLLVTKVGDIQTEEFQIPDVYLVPGLQMNLISVRQLARSKIFPTFYENHAELRQEGELVGGAIADDETSLYRLHHLTPIGNAAALTS